MKFRGCGILVVCSALLVSSAARADDIEAAIANYEKCITSQISKNKLGIDSTKACSEKLEKIVRVTPSSMRGEMRSILAAATTKEYDKQIKKGR